MDDIDASLANGQDYKSAIENALLQNKHAMHNLLDIYDMEEYKDDRNHDSDMDSGKYWLNIVVNPMPCTKVGLLDVIYQYVEL